MYILLIMFIGSLLIAADVQAAVLGIVAYFLARKLVLDKEEKGNWLYIIVYLLLTFIWRSVSIYLGSRSGFWDPYFHIWQRNEVLPVWTVIFGVWLWLLIVIQKYRKEKSNKTKAFIKIAVLILFEILLIGCLVYMESISYPY